MNKPVKKFSKASVSGFVFAFFSPLFIVLIFLLLYYRILSFYHPFGEWFYWLVVNILVAGTLVFNRAGIVFSLIGLINSFRKHTKGKGFAIVGIFLSEMQAAVYFLGFLVYLLQKAVWTY